MKSRSFRYIRPASLAHAYAILTDAGGDAVPIAGGQSLLAGLNMRLSAPKLVIDIGDLGELMDQSHAGGVVRLGALTRHGDLLRSELVRRHLPLLTQAAPHIGHIAIRNRGTLGGSLAYADPAAELPACAVALGATLVLGSSAGEREVKAEDFFKGLFETDLQPGELIVAVKFPIMQNGTAAGDTFVRQVRGERHRPDRPVVAGHGRDPCFEELERVTVAQSLNQIAANGAGAMEARQKQQPCDDGHRHPSRLHQSDETLGETGGQTER